MTTDVAESYRACRRLTLAAHSSFAPAFVLLPSHKRQAMYALYAFMRHTDDLGDAAEPPALRRVRLAEWRAAVQRALEGQRDCAGNLSVIDGAALLPALADAVARFAVPSSQLLAAIDGQELDLDRSRYDTFAELEDYCVKVGSSVGLACLPIWGCRAGGESPARAAGIAFQLTNVLRDVGEDAARGRRYLPAEDLRQAGYAEPLRLDQTDERFYRLVAWEVVRARGYYRAAAELMDLLHADGRRIFAMMSQTYWALLQAIAADPAAVLRRRVRLSAAKKLTIAVTGLLRPRFPKVSP